MAFAKKLLNVQGSEIFAGFLNGLLSYYFTGGAVSFAP